MFHPDGLIATIAIGLVIAFVGGFVATRLRLPAIVGYLLAGVAVGPFTPGFVANPDVSQELAEIGVILLMFGVGIHFSLRDLVAVRAVAVPGALGQSAVATTVGTIMALSWGWNLGAGMVLGLAVSVASTVVLLRALAERNAIHSIHGHVAVGWLIVEDLFTVLVLVMLPAIATAVQGASGGGIEHIVMTLGIALGKVAILTVLMLVVGARVVPWILTQVSYTGSRELFTLAVLALALGIAVLAATVFGASLALGAFMAGIVVGESDMSHQAAADALPLRDAFSVLFFVSVGMLFNPALLLAAPLQILAILFLVIVIKGLTALAIVSTMGYPMRTGLTVAAGLAQVGEFSFILAELGRSLDVLPEEGRSLILAAAILSITVNPLLFRAVDPIEEWIRGHPRIANLIEQRRGALAQAPTGEHGVPRRGHAVLCGFGKVGSLVAHALDQRGFNYVVIDQDRRQVEALRKRGVPAFYGDAANPVFLEDANVATASVVIVAMSDPPVSRHIIDEARKLNVRVKIVARTESEAERAHLMGRDVDDVVLGDREVAAEMARYTLHRLGLSGPELQYLVQGLRQRGAEA
jgi:CPA2 family monovalent cation:H+ antiporter-2